MQMRVQIAPNNNLCRKYLSCYHFYLSHTNETCKLFCIYIKSNYDIIILGLPQKTAFVLAPFDLSRNSFVQFLILRERCGSATTFAPVRYSQPQKNELPVFLASNITACVVAPAWKMWVLHMQLLQQRTNVSTNSITKTPSLTWDTKNHNKKVKYEKKEYRE